MKNATVHARCRPVPKPLSLALLAALVSMPAHAVPPPDEVPTGGSVVSGTAAISAPGANALLVNQASNGAIIEWTTFSIGQDASVNFVHPTAGGVTLNRVLTTVPSEIFGTLGANGRVFVINPNGVVFGGTAQVNVGGLVASTLPITNADFLAGVASGSFTFGDPSTEFHDSVAVEAGASLVASTGGTIALLGGEVGNLGQVSATGGTAVLASAREVTLDFFGDGLTQVSLSLLGSDDGGVVIGEGAQVEADGGRAVIGARTFDGDPSSAPSSGFIVNNGVVRARSLTSRNGEIILDSDEGHVELGGGTIDATGGAGLGGGSIDISGGFIAYGFLDGDPVAGLVDASGDAGGGEVRIAATQRLGILSSDSGGGGPLAVRADARVQGAGGLIEMSAGELFGLPLQVSANGLGAAGGQILTAGEGAFDLRGVEASASGSTPGVWRIQTGQNFYVDSGSGAPDPGDLEPGFGAVWDSDLSAALDSGTRIEVVAGGQLNLLPGVSILRQAGTGPLGLSLQSDGGLLFGGIGFDGTIGAWGIRSTAGPLDVSLQGLSTVGLYQGTVHSNGGDIDIAAFASADTGVDMFQTDIDSRTGQDDAGAAGDISVFGNGGAIGIAVFDSQLQSGSGNLSLYGIAASTDDSGAIGVVLDSFGVGGRSVLGTSSGSIDVVGLAESEFAATGVLLASADVASGSGDIRIVGRSGGNAGSTGLALLDGQFGAPVVDGGGNVLLAGQSAGGGDGLVVGIGASVDGAAGVTLSAGAGSGTALVIDGTVGSDVAVNLRAGSVDVEGQVEDDVDTEMVLGGAGAAFTSIASLDNISTPQLTVGHALHQGDIRLAQAHARSGNLTLHTGGGIEIDAALDLEGGRLGLLAGGDIGQAAAIQAGSLLVRSSGGSAILDNVGNLINGNTIAADVSGNFSFVNSDTVTIGTVTDPNGGTVVGITAGGDIFVRSLGGDLVQLAQVSGGGLADLVSSGVYLNSGAGLSAGGRWKVWADTWVGESRGGVAGDGPLPNLYNCAFEGACGVTVSLTANQFIYAQQPTATISIDSLLREYGLANPDFTFSVDGLILGDSFGTAISGGASSAAGVASDVGSYAITGSFASAAGYAITVVPGVLQVTPAVLTYLADPYTRLFGVPSGPFSGSVTGFRNGEGLADATTGVLAWTSPAGTDALPGTYAIEGSGLSARNYVFVQDPGNATALRVLPVNTAIPVDLVRENPTTYLYDRNIGPTLMCPETALVDSTRVDPGTDTLAREWSRVRSRPNLTSCVASEQRNGCGDF